MYWDLRSVACPRSEVCSCYRSVMDLSAAKPTGSQLSCGICAKIAMATWLERAHEYEAPNYSAGAEFGSSSTLLKLGRGTSADSDQFARWIRRQSLIRPNMFSILCRWR
jgi:hypothetical protein